MAFKVTFTSLDDAGVQKIETTKAPGGHVSVANGLVIVDDAGTQVFAVPLEKLVSIEKVA